MDSINILLQNVMVALSAVSVIIVTIYCIVVATRL